MSKLEKKAEQTVKLMKYKETKTNFQPNIITSSRQEMTVYERRLFTIVLSQIDRRQNIDTGVSLIFEIPIKELTKNEMIPYRAMKSVVKNIQQKNIFSESEKAEEFENHIVFPSVLYNKNKNGLIIIELNRNLVPYFIELGKQYISYDLNSYLSLSSVYSQRLYEIILMYLLRQKPQKKPIEISVQYLQSRLQCNYPNWADFKRRVLDSAKKELSEKSILMFDYMPSKRDGKKVVEIEIKVTDWNGWHKKRDEQLTPIEPVEPTIEDDYKTSLEYFFAQNIDTQNEMTRQALEQYKLTKKQKEKILLSAEIKQLFIEIHLKIQVGLLTIEKPSAYIATALF
jgi:plasmid replication initiation protein